MDQATEHHDGGRFSSEEREVERLALEFLAACEDEQSPSLARYQAKLASPRDRDELARLVGAAMRAARTFPLQLRAGEILAGRYQLIEEIGSGGTGRVWAALDRELQRQVAIKVVDRVVGAEAEERMARERRALVSVKHPSVVPIHDAGRTEAGRCFLVMERIEGRSLAEVVRRLQEAGSDEPTAADLASAVGGMQLPGRQPLIDSRSYAQSVARIVAEVLKALEAAHAEGVVHRDLKPSNVLLRPGGHPAIVDFGLATLRGAAAGDVTRGLYGSPGYLAPEQLAARETGIDPRIDVYQAGLLLYALLARRDAFPRDTSSTTLTSIARGEIPPLRQASPAVPWELVAICRRATAREVAGRYASARAFREDLERYLGGRVPPEACADAPGAVRLRYLLRRRGWPIAAAALLVLVVWLASSRGGAARATATVGAGDTIEVTIPGLTKALAALLVLEREGGDTLFLPLHADPKEPTRFRLPEGVGRGVLTGSAGQPLVWCYAADDRKKIEHVDASIEDARVLVERGGAVYGLSLAELGKLLQRAATTGRGTGGPPVPMPPGFGIEEILGNRPITVAGASLLRIPLDPPH